MMMMMMKWTASALRKRLDSTRLLHYAAIGPPALHPHKLSRARLFCGRRNDVRVFSAWLVAAWIATCWLPRMHVENSEFQRRTGREHLRFNVPHILKEKHFLFELTFNISWWFVFSCEFYFVRCSIINQFHCALHDFTFVLSNKVATDIQFFSISSIRFQLRYENQYFDLWKMKVFYSVKLPSCTIIT